MLLALLQISDYLLFVLLVHGEDLVLPRAVSAGRTLQGLVKPLIPAAQASEMLAL